MFNSPKIQAALLLALCLCIHPIAAAKQPFRIFVVSSYHKAYLWSQDTSQGMLDALNAFGYFDHTQQLAEFQQYDKIKTHKMVMQRHWMDTKHHNKTNEIASSADQTIGLINAFKPDLILLGDDNATNWIGNEFLDTDVPMVFWGVNGTPVKYGLLENQRKPGHNITGVYQAGYLKESIQLLQTLVPSVKTIAVISDDSTTGRSKVREIANLVNTHQVPVQLLDTIHTDNYETWKQAFIRLQHKVDAFIIFNHNSLIDAAGKVVPQMVAGRWYLEHIQKPECSHEAQFVIEGLLCATDDSGYKQAYEAVKIAIRILEKGENPAVIPAYAPPRGAFMVNAMRAKQLGIQITPDMGVESIISSSKALE